MVAEICTQALPRVWLQTRGVLCVANEIQQCAVSQDGLSGSKGQGSLRYLSCNVGMSHVDGDMLVLKITNMYNSECIAVLVSGASSLSPPYCIYIV